MHGGSAKFSDLYELQEDIGVGSYSICKRCVHRVSAMDYAVKVEVLKLFTKIKVCHNIAPQISQTQVEQVIQMNVSSRKVRYYRLPDIISQ